MSLLLAVMVLLSQTFTSGSTVPQSMVATPCGGSNVSPQLHWSGVPKGARSLALIVHDPDAPHAGGFNHWVFYNLAPDVRSIDAASQLPALQSGLNGTGAKGYFGPCPPAGKLHHYNFTLYALDSRVDASAPLDAAGLLAKMHGHILAQATLTGTLQR